MRKSDVKSVKPAPKEDIVGAVTARLAEFERKALEVKPAPVVVSAPVAYEFEVERDDNGFMKRIIATPLVN